MWTESYLRSQTRSYPHNAPERWNLIDSQYDRKYPDGHKLRKKGSDGFLQYEVTVMGATYDSGKHTWMYALKDYKSEDIKGTTPEDQLR